MEDKNAIYTEQILPLIKQIDGIAAAEGIPFVMVFQTSDDDHMRSASIPKHAHKEMRQLWEWLEV